MKPVKAEVPADSPPARKASRTAKDTGADTYIEVLVNDSRRHPTGARKTVRARLLKRYPMSVLVELPDGAVVKRRLGRDVVSGLSPHIERGVLRQGSKETP